MRRRESTVASREVDEVRAAAFRVARAIRVLEDLVAQHGAEKISRPAWSDPAWSDPAWSDLVAAERWLRRVLAYRRGGDDP